MRKVNQGLSLIELMISMAIGLVLVAAMITLYVNQSKSYRQIEALSRMQENARYAFEIMGHDLRMAGNWSCYTPGQTTPANFINSPTINWWSNSQRPLYGAVESGSVPADYSGNVLRGDTVLVLRADTDAVPGVVGTYDLNTDAIPIAGATYASGDLLVLTDCRQQTTIFQASDFDNISSEIEHAQGVSPTPGNCKDHLFGTTCAELHTPTDVTGAKVMPLLAHAYYLRNSPRLYSNSTVNIPSLYRQILTKDANDNVITIAEELVDSVIDMQVLYGVDTDITPDKQIDDYQTAAEIENGSGTPAVPGANSTERWQRALAVQVTLTLQSTENNLTTSNQTFTYGNGTSVTDRRLRRQFTATFGIRSRLQ